ncbi:MAG: hypothetical protein O7I93_12240 [Gemmatimonadetes bacterium]|nr:hypothetical protein [Gemmatimonadota bacterium]
MHPTIALSVLEAVRAGDRPAGDSVTGNEANQEAIRLGRTRSVAGQIERYALMVRRHVPADLEEVTGLFTLVSRRSDANLLFAEAGRRAGKYAADSAPGLLRLLRRAMPGSLGRRVSRRLVRGAAERVLGMDVTLTDAGVSAVETDGVGAVPGGLACGWRGSGLAELLRAFTPFDGACFHVSCRANGDAACTWSTSQDGED